MTSTYVLAAGWAFAKICDDITKSELTVFPEVLGDMADGPAYCRYRYPLRYLPLCTFAESLQLCRGQPEASAQQLSDVSGSRK